MTLLNKLKVAGTIGITALAAGCGTVGPDGRTDGERIMDGFTESFIGGGGLFKANEQIAASEGDYKKAAAWGALVNTAEANYNRQTQIEAAREGRTQVNVNVGGQQQTDDYIVIGDKKIYGRKMPDGSIEYDVPQDPKTQLIIQERLRKIGGVQAPREEKNEVRMPGAYVRSHQKLDHVIISTYNYLSDLDKDDVYDFPEDHIGLKDKFSKNERITVELGSPNRIPDINYKLLNKNGEIIDKYNLREDGQNSAYGVLRVYNYKDSNTEITLSPGSYTSLWYTGDEFLGKLEFEVYDEK